MTRPVSPEKIAPAAEFARIRGTYENFRRAVVTENEAMKRALYPVLYKDRAAASQCAQEDLARAQTDLDRATARKVLEDLRR